VGEIAESLINGEFDYISGEYMGKPVGYPRTRERMGVKQTINFRNRAAMFNGVATFLDTKGYVGKKLRRPILEAYALHNELPDAVNISNHIIAEHIQANWRDFLYWFNTNYLNKKK